MLGFDFTDGDMVFGDGEIGFDSEGNSMLSLGEGLAMDMDTGEVHFVIGWDDGINNV